MFRSETVVENNSVLSSIVVAGVITSLSLILFPTITYADVFVPENEYVGYYDYEGVFTVVGNVKNQNDFALIPTLTISVIDDGTRITKILHHVPIPAMTDIPFKLKFPEVQSENLEVLKAELKFVKTKKNPVPIQIIYDKTLITHDDGHVTGRIQNVGNYTVYNPKVYAIVHGIENYVLDVAHNISLIEKIKPGEILNFTIYPDPSISETVRFYSCFAPVDTTVIPISTKKNDGNFDFRYDSGAWFSAAKFNEDGTEMIIRGYNSYPLETYANFEFPPISGEEKFDVTVDDQPIEFIQSIDEMGQWHVAFLIEPRFQAVVKISGFEKGLPPEVPKIPQWIKTNAEWWATDQIPDSEFLEGIDFLFKKGVVFVSGKQLAVESAWEIPSWIKTPASWWAEGKISDDEFLNAIENLVKREIIVI
ncbi:peptidase [Nitrosopumilus sp. K4]|uniref:peptidase n=1 Tax=Nitrosopumilus sp. K4 TaxID=2795383 RepID=UPI001BA908CD|nr:peptidase [Nitrosopumilus sp. K4]QUC64727.1 peptidase [Nitrosopumilus sp. K4]